MPVEQRTQPAPEPQRRNGDQPRHFIPSVYNTPLSGMATKGMPYIEGVTASGILGLGGRPKTETEKNPIDEAREEQERYAEAGKRVHEAVLNTVAQGVRMTPELQRKILDDERKRLKDAKST